MLHLQVAEKSSHWHAGLQTLVRGTVLTAQSNIVKMNYVKLSVVIWLCS